MRKALKCNDRSYEWLINNCKSQADLASVERKSVGIQPMSLNTFKKYANEILDGGFKEIDRLRRTLKNYKQNKPASKKLRLKDDLERIKDRLDKAERTRAILIKAYSELNQITLDLLANTPKYQNEYERHKKLYAAHFGLCMVVDNG